MTVHRSRAVGASASGDFVQIDYSGVSELVRAFGRLPAATQTRLKAAVREAANLVADQAKANASFSSWIPGAITVQTPLSAKTQAVVRVVSSKAPTPDHEALPRLMEFGTPFFRHPVFGNTDAWVSQPGHPFLFPAVAEKADEARADIAEAVRAAAAEVGLV